MDCIVSHNNVDFDGLASMLAASILYPGAVMIQPATQERSVRNFLTLYRHSLEMTKQKYIDLARITRLIVVDTADPAKIGKPGCLFDDPGVVKIVYDHHPSRLTPEECERNNITLNFAQSGATVTQLVKRLRARKTRIQPFTATLLLLGIYDDTGAMTYTSTTPDDLIQAAWLLSSGASLSFIQDFIRPQLSTEQMNLLNTLMSGLSIRQCKGVTIAISFAELERYVGDLAVITHKIRDLENLPVLVVAVRMGDRVHIVARSRVEGVDVGRMATAMGGGGHSTAASAVVRTGDVHAVVGRIETLLEEMIIAPRTAADLMTSPVKTVESGCPVIDAKKIMIYYGIKGLPVVNSGRLIGIISHGDIDKAIHHNLAHAPVKGFMTSDVVTVNSSASIYEVKRTLLSNSIGRLPVLGADGVGLVGIITGTDFLRVLHDDLLAEPFSTYDVALDLHFMEARNLRRDIARSVPMLILDIFHEAGRTADELGMKLFIVGGFVRDILMAGLLPGRLRQTRDGLDMDLVVEGDGIRFADALRGRVGGMVRVHRKFKTAALITDEGFKIDVATARFEHYEYPAALPRVEEGSIKHDLYRRDFTINAMAIRLNEGGFGQLLDYFGGQEDIRSRKIRVLHNLSFVEDPTRMLRAARFAARYGFKIDSMTESLIESSVELKMLKRTSSKRLRTEFMLILEEKSAASALRILARHGLLSQICPGSDPSAVDEEIFTRIDRTVSTLISDGHFREDQVSAPLVKIMILLSPAGPSAPEEAVRLLGLNRRESRAVKFLETPWDELVAALGADRVKKSLIHSLLKDLGAEEIVFLAASDFGTRIRRRVWNFLRVLRHVKIDIRGDDLLALGVTAGPEMSRILDAVMVARLDGTAMTRAKELELARVYMASGR